jgi:hypothetical protein
MPTIESPHWDEEHGVCLKHGLPQLPCSACLDEQDKDITVRFTARDRDEADFNLDGSTLLDLLPADLPWLKDRIVP